MSGCIYIPIKLDLQQQPPTKAFGMKRARVGALLTGKQLPLQCLCLCVRHISDDRGKSQTLEFDFTRKPRETDLKVNIELPSHFLSFSRTVLSRREKHGKATQNSGIRSLHLNPSQVSSILPGDKLLVLPLP